MSDMRGKKLPQEMFIRIDEFNGDEPSAYLAADNRDELVERNEDFTFVGIYKLVRVERLALEVKIK